MQGLFVGRLAEKHTTLEKVRKDLLDYCKQDTSAMVKLLEVIEKKVKVATK